MTIRPMRAALALSLAVTVGCTAPDGGSTAAPTTAAPTTTAEPTTTTAPTTTSTVPPADRFEAPGPRIGIAVQQGRVDAVRDVEEAAGVGVHLVRVFARWDTALDQTDVAELQADGRQIHLSVRPMTATGEPIAWLDIAEAEPGSDLHREMVAWADEVAGLGPGTYFTFNHEPETRESAGNGTEDDYVAAWRRMAELVRERAGDEVRLVWTVGAGVLADPSGERWYPGDDVVDVIGADTYNWFTCQGTDRPWESFERLLRPSLLFAQRHDKPLALPEFASASDPADPASRPSWIDAATDTLLRVPALDRVEFVAWFSVTAPDGNYPDCVWDVDADEGSEQAFGRMVRRLVGSE